MNATTYTMSKPIYRAPVGVRQSYAPTTKVFVTPSGEGRPMKYGDRIFVRLVMGRRTVAEFELSNVNDYTELLGELRYRTQGLDGLAQLYVRNMTRGWSQERPMRLYADMRRPMRRTQRPVATQTRRMLCPWETH